MADYNDLMKLEKKSSPSTPSTPSTPVEETPHNVSLLANQQTNKEESKQADLSANALTSKPASQQTTKLIYYFANKEVS